MKKPKLSRKRCSPLLDIYTLFDKTSSSYLASKTIKIYLYCGHVVYRAKDAWCL
jgi:hypothetical protein